MMSENLEEKISLFGKVKKLLTRKFRPKNTVDWLKTGVLTGLGGLLVGYLGYAVSPIYYTLRHPVTPEDRTYVLTSRETKNLQSLGQSLGIDLNQIDEDKPNWNLSPEEYKFASTYVSSIRAFFSSAIKANSDPYFIKAYSGIENEKASWIIKELDRLAYASEIADERGRRLDSEIFSRARFPEEVIPDLSELCLVRVNENYFGGEVTGELRGSDFYIEHDNISGLLKIASKSCGHEGFHDILSKGRWIDKEQLRLIKDDVWRFLVKPRFCRLTRVSHIMQELKSDKDYNPSKSLTEQTPLNQRRMNEIFSLENSVLRRDTEIHNLMPEELIVDYLTAKSLGWNSVEIAQRMQIDESSQQALQRIFNRRKGRGWDTNWKEGLSIRPQVRDCNFNNVGYFVLKNLCVPYDIAKRAPKIASDYYDLLKINYLDSPLETCSVLGLGAGLVAAGVLYPLSRTRKPKERRTARDDNKRRYQQSYRNLE